MSEFYSVAKVGDIAPGEMTYVEVGPDEVPRLADRWDDLAPRLRSLGFESVAIDRQGYRRGGADLGASSSS